MKTWVLAIILLIMPSAVMAQDAIDLVVGSWGIDLETVPEGKEAEELERRRGCRGSPVKITVDTKTMRYKAVHTGSENFVATGDILDVQKKWISLRYDDEERLMKNGKPKVWHIFFVSHDKFYWLYGPGVKEGEREGMVRDARVRCRYAGV